MHKVHGSKLTAFWWKRKKRQMLSSNLSFQWSKSKKPAAVARILPTGPIIVQNQSCLPAACNSKNFSLYSFWSTLKKDPDLLWYSWYALILLAAVKQKERSCWSWSECADVLHWWCAGRYRWGCRCWHYGLVCRWPSASTSATLTAATDNNRVML